jgi:hypothetical protein
MSQHQMHYLVPSHQQQLHREAHEARLAAEARTAASPTSTRSMMSPGGLLGRLRSRVSRHVVPRSAPPTIVHHIVHAVR